MAKESGRRVREWKIAKEASSRLEESLLSRILGLERQAKVGDIGFNLVSSVVRCKDEGIFAISKRTEQASRQSWPGTGQDLEKRVQASDSSLVNKRFFVME